MIDGGQLIGHAKETTLQHQVKGFRTRLRRGRKAFAMNALKPTYVVEADRVQGPNLSEFWAYRELYLLLVKRDFIAAYKQTVLGPLWFFIQPFLASLVFFVVFSQIARLPTTDLPPLVYYMSGIILWNYFANCLTQVSFTFLSNGGVFRKIHFPRLIMPLSHVSMNLLNFMAQLLVLFAVIAVYNLTGTRVIISPNVIFVLPILIAIGLFAFGLGCLIASATVKYRDLNIVVGYIVQLWMYGSLVIYPRSLVPVEWRTLMAANPMATFVEWYRASLFTTEHALINPLLFAICCTAVALVAGIWCFIRAEGTFTDSI
jgi:lipopolysaccharide transport system permease protein